MEYSAGTSWLQQQHISDLHDVRATTNDDWKEPSTSMSPGPGTSGPQPSMDLSDFGLDIPGELPSTPNQILAPVSSYKYRVNSSRSLQPSTLDLQLDHQPLLLLRCPQQLLSHRRRCTIQCSLISPLHVASILPGAASLVELFHTEWCNYRPPAFRSATTTFLKYPVNDDRVRFPHLSIPIVSLLSLARH